MLIGLHQREITLLRAVKSVALVWLLVALSSCSLFFEGPTRYIIYPVQPGDNLYQIARDFKVDQKRLARLNRLRNPERLAIGQVIKIPYETAKDIAVVPQRPDSYRARIAQAPENKSSDKKNSLRKIKLSRASYYIGKLTWPLKDPKLSSKFGWRWFSFHEGIDFKGAYGTPIYAAHSGQVVYSSNGLRGYGNMVVIDSKDGLMTVYGHNKKNLVQTGQYVRQGQKIALLGSSGKSSGPHLHFETRVKDERGRNAAVDPLVFFP